MTEGMQHMLELGIAGGMFCMALILLLCFHETFCLQNEKIGRTPEQMILFEEIGE